MIYSRRPLPAWLSKPRSAYAYSKNALRGYDYWTSIYWATPPWLSRQQRKEMREIYRHAKATGKHVDHVVPLKGATVSGLNVPWNLVPIDPLENAKKQAAHWPDQPMQPQDLFDPHRYQPFELTAHVYS